MVNIAYNYVEALPILQRGRQLGGVLRAKAPGPYCLGLTLHVAAY